MSGGRPVECCAMGKRRDNLFDFDPSRAKGPRKGPDVGRDVTGDFFGNSGSGGGAPGGGAASGGEASGGVASGGKAASGKGGGKASGGKVAGGKGGRQAASRAVSVSALVARVKGVLADGMGGRVTVVGELSNVKFHGSGHVYFRLKDARCAIDAVMFRGSAGKLKFRPADGLEVVAQGRVDVYDARGQLQLYVERMTPKGAGSLELAFRQLKEKLDAEGLFAAAGKKAIPRFPRAVGVITSQTGAAVRDISRTLRRRWPAAEVYLLPSLVQGEGAACQIAERIALLDASAGRLGIDTIIVARGGGSLEDLWAFNEEPVARAVFACRTPVISGVGHEVDVTICDMVADVRAATPTAAAELAVPDAMAVGEQVSQAASRAFRRMRERLDSSRLSLASVGRSSVLRDPLGRVRVGVQRVDELSHRLRGGVRHRVAEARRAAEPAAGRLAALHPARLRERASARVDGLLSRLGWALGGRSKSAGEVLSSVSAKLLAASPANRMKVARQQVLGAARQLEAMSYRRVLRRGFSVTRSDAGVILRSAGEAVAGEVIETELVDGKVRSRVAGGEAGGKTSKVGKPGGKSRLNGSRRGGEIEPGLFDRSEVEKE